MTTSLEGLDLAALDRHLREAGIPPVPAAIALDMTECDVVKRAGVAERAEIGTNDRSERTATLTYTRGERPGIYNFVDGRLKSMELGPDQPALFIEAQG